MADSSKGASVRARLLEELGTATGTDGWAKSTNPVKKRIGRLEVGWREAIQWLLEDIRRMFKNHEDIADAYDVVDVNIAAVKSLCVDKGIFTEEEFKARQKQLFVYVDAERRRRQVELEAKLAEERAKKEGKSGDVVADKNVVDPGLVKMRDSAADTAGKDHEPDSAYIFGGGEPA